MSFAAIPAHGHGPATAAGVVPLSPGELYRMNVSKYERLASLGALDDPRIELINGYLVRKRGKNPPYVRSVEAAEIELGTLLPAGWLIRRESPVRMPEFDEPEPDVAVVKGTRVEYKTGTQSPATSASSSSSPNRASIATEARSCKPTRGAPFPSIGS
jgi:Putative restriction endonuclease